MPGLWLSGKGRWQTGAAEKKGAVSRCLPPAFQTAGAILKCRGGPRSANLPLRLLFGHRHRTRRDKGNQDVNEDIDEIGLRPDGVIVSPCGHGRRVHLVQRRHMDEVPLPLGHRGLPLRCFAHLVRVDGAAGQNEDGQQQRNDPLFRGKIPPFSRNGVNGRKHGLVGPSQGLGPGFSEKKRPVGTRSRRSGQKPAQE